MRRVWHRIYSNFLMRTRLDEYRDLITAALAEGYEFHSVISFWRRSRAGLDSSRKYLILRHDVDTDAETAYQMHRIEREYGVPATYYYRLCTLHVPHMQAIEASGSEASYHYEEIATVCKEKGLGCREEIEQHMPEIRARFRANLISLRAQTGLSMVSVASHGDFVNRHLQIPNLELINGELRRDLGIEVEAYDAPLMRLVTNRFTDTHYPRFWRTYSPLVAIRRGDPVVHILTHPRNWQTAPLENLIVDVRRAAEGVSYRVKMAVGRGVRDVG